MTLWIRIDGDDQETMEGRFRPFDGEWASLGEAIVAVRQFRRPQAGPTLQAHQDLEARVSALEGAAAGVQAYSEDALLAALDADATNGKEGG